MTNRIILSFFLSLYCFISYGQWQWVNPKPSGYACNKIAFVSPEKGFILNANGDLIVTGNQGESWQLAENFPGAIAMDFSGTTGAVAGYSGTFYVSNDNGASWQKKATGIMDYFEMVHVIDRDTIFLANNNGKVYRTDNGGQSWRTFSCGRYISSIEFVNSKVGYAGGSNSVILKTEDGGQSWSEVVKVNTIPSNTLSLHFLNADTGFAFREHSTLLKTTDGGKSWTSTSVHDRMYSIFFVNASVGYMAGEHGVIYRTTDGGANWAWAGFDARIYANDMKSVYFINEQTGFAVGLRGRILKTTNGGATWKPYSFTYLDFGDISFPTNLAGYAISGKKIYKTVDGGDSWQDLNFDPNKLSTYGGFNYCKFFNEDTGIVTVNNMSRIYKTYDGGSTWRGITPTTWGMDHLLSMSFVNSKVGYLSLKGSVRPFTKTTDGGDTWQDMECRLNFNSLFFVNEGTGYGAQYEKLYKTVDSAKTWKEVLTNDYDDIYSIYFISPSTGFVAGEDGLLKRTTDSGKNWTQITNIKVPYPDDLLKIRFLDDRIGYITCEDGTIFKTIDGGLNWQVNGKSANDQCRAIEFTKDGRVFIAGGYGAILKASMAEYRVDSIKVNAINNCSIEFYSVITAILDSINNIRFEYGTNSFDNVLPASQNAVVDQQGIARATVSNLLPGTTYKVRVGFTFQGKTYYSNEVMFRTQDEPAVPLITASGKTTFCQGDSVILQSSAITGNQWLLNGSPVNGATNRFYIANAAGDYSVVATGGCYAKTSAVTTVIVNPIPGRPVITAASKTLSSSSITGNQWFLNGTALTAATSQQYIPQTSGRYTVQVTEKDCTSPVSNEYNFVINADTSMWNGEVQVYPNPINDKLFIENKKDRKLKIMVINAQGHIAHESLTSVHSITIDVRALASGIYVLSITDTGSNESVGKLIIKQ